MFFTVTGMNWEEKASGWSGKVKLNYSCTVCKCENTVCNEHIPISTLRSSFQCSWFSSALCVLRFGSLCFLCICPVPACNVVTASRDTAGMRISWRIYMKWCVDSTYKYPPSSDSSGQLFRVWSCVFRVRVWCPQRAGLHRVDWKRGAHITHLLTWTKTFALLSVFKQHFRNRRESERFVNPPCFTWCIVGRLCITTCCGETGRLRRCQKWL